MSDPLLLSVLVPLFNEEEFIAPILERVLDAPLPDGMKREIVVVDDGSSDGSAEIVAEMAARHPEIRLVRQDRNRGKGAAIRTAIEHRAGRFLHHSGRGSRIRPARIREPAAASARRQSRRRVRLALHDRGRAPGALLLALGGEPPAHGTVQSGGGPQPHRHGDLLQGVPHVAVEKHSPFAASASASSRS